MICQVRLILSECYTPDLTLSLEHRPRTHSFGITRPCLIVEVLANRAKFLQPSGYCNMIDYTFTFRPMNISTCFGDVMACFELVKHVSELDYIARSSVYLSNHTRTEAMHSVSAHRLPQHYQLLWVTTMVWTASIIWYTHHRLTCTTKILQNFWLNQEVLVCIICFKNVNISMGAPLWYNDFKVSTCLPSLFIYYCSLPLVVFVISVLFFK